MKKIEGPTILVLNEKYGNVYFIVNNDDELYATALKILTARFNSGHFYHNPGEFKIPPPEEWKHDADRIPKELLNRSVTPREAYGIDKERHEEELQAYLSIKHVVTTKDGASAWYLLKERDGYEYEGYELEEPCKEYRV